MARELLHQLRRARGMASLRLGRITSVHPLSRSSGFDRGQPIDRFYIESFLAAHSEDIRGRVLEVGGDSYSKRFGGTRVSKLDVLHIDGSNPSATIVGDLATRGLLRAGTYDCIILTQVLQYVYDLPAALKQVRKALAPSGVVLITAPGVAPVCLDAWQDSYYWRFSAEAVKRLLGEAFGPGSVEVTPYGNLYAATLFLHGAAVEEARRSKLASVMPEYAVVIAARGQAAPKSSTR